MKINELLCVKADAQITDMVSGQLTFASDWMINQQKKEDRHAAILPYAEDPLYIGIESFIVSCDGEIEHVNSNTNLPIIGLIFQDEMSGRFYSVHIDDVESIGVEMESESGA